MQTKVFISPLSFGQLTKEALDYESLEQLNADLLTQISEFTGCKLNEVELTTDILEEGVKDSLLDIYLHLAENDDQIFIYLVDDFEKKLSRYKGYLNTDTAKETINAEPLKIGHFSCAYQLNANWPNIDKNSQVGSTQALHQFNGDMMGEYPISPHSFAERAKILFDRIEYHEDFTASIATIKNGDFTHYSKVFVHALNSLHHAVDRLSSQGHNAPDMLAIRTVSGELGKTLDCTLQGKNKQQLFYEFTLFGQPKQTINCEHHLKLDVNNKGKKLDRKHYNRAYFGLPLIDGRKHIVLAHLGCHL